MARLVKREVGAPHPAETLTLQSEILGQERRVYVQTPSSYDETAHVYPLLLVLDGEWLFELARAHVRFYSEHQAMGFEIPRMIVVGVENVDRDTDYVPTPDPAENPVFPTAGKADQFLKFLRDELFPLLDAQYRVAPGRVVVGWSFGGLCAAYAAIATPGLFDAHLCISPAVWWDDERILRQFEKTTLDRPKRMVFTLGAEEVDGCVYDSTKKLLSQLERDPIEHLSVTHLEFEGAGHTLGVPLALGQGLRALFPGYRPLVTNEGFSLAELRTRYAELSDAWGFDVEPSASVVLLSAQYRQKAGQPEQALEILDWYLDRYKTHSLIHFQRGAILASLGTDARGLDAYRAALAVECRLRVPNDVYVRAYRSRISKAEAADGG